MKKIGHRGLRGVKLENTIESIIEAVNCGMDMVEIDVQVTKDDKVVVFHDYDLKRLFGYKEKIKDINYIDIIKITDCIPLLEDIFQVLSQSGTELNIEIKEILKRKIILEHIIEMLKKYDYHSKVVISSFDHTILRDIKKLDSRIKTAVLIVAKPVDPVAVVKAAGADGYHPNHSYVDREIVEACHRKGYFVNIWTVNEKEEVDYFKKMGVDGIVSDYDIF